MEAREFVTEIFKREFAISNIDELLTPEENTYFHKDNASERENIYFSCHYESLWMLLWSLGLVEWTEPRVCESMEVNEIVRSYSSMKDMLFRTKLRGIKEIQDKAALIAGYAKDIAEMKKSKTAVPDREYAFVTMTRHKALNWLTRLDNADWDDVRGYFDD